MRLSVVLALALVVLAGTAFAPAAAPAADDLPWPDRRFAPCAAFDAMHRDWYVFGGRGEGARAHFADAWRLDVRAERWQRVAGADAAAAPPPVRSCAAAFDSRRKRMLVFGGWDGVTATNGVWALTAGPSPRWERVCDAESCGPPPTARRAAQMVYDPAGHRLLLFGGLDDRYRNDLWELSLDGAPRWRELPATGPQPQARAGHAMAYDTQQRRVWLFGGTSPGPDLADTWSLDPGTATWQRVAEDRAPAARSGAVLVYDRRASRLVLHGGWESGPNRYPRDTWTLSELGAAPRWSRAEPQSEAPQARYFGVGTYDPLGRRMLVFGGGVGATALKDVAQLRLRGNRLAWRGLAPRTALTARDQAAVGYVARTDNLFAFGGFGSGAFPGRLDAGTHLADTWRLRRGRWRNVTARAVPLHREAAAVATDEAGSRLFMIGGLEGDDELADVWVAGLRGRTPRWRQLCTPTSCGAGPQARWGGNAAYDPDHDRVVVFGGRRTDGTSFGDVWALSLGGRPTWSRLEPTGTSPAARWGAASGYDPVHREFVVAGGQTGSDAAAVSHDDTWALSLDGPPTWRRISTVGPAPAPRRSAAYAMRGGQLIVSGGLNAASGQHFNDVWSLVRGEDGVAWQQLAPSNCGDAAAPACRRSASAVYDRRRDRLVMVFGRDAERFFADTWSFDFEDRRWQASSPTEHRSE